jgi:DNA/RNA endonuclease YhcR with UshA esterase domain
MRIYGFDIYQKEKEKIKFLLTDYKSRLKGISGEEKVANCLENIDADGLYAICHPKLLNFEPDILICSTNDDIGFKIVEVKNWSIDVFENVEINGYVTFKDKNRKNSNPSNQALLHVEDLRTFLLNYFQGNKNFLIDYMVIFPNISLKEFEKKFTINWNKDGKTEFLKRHLFKEEIQDPNVFNKKIINCKKKESHKNEFINDKSMQNFIDSLTIGDEFDYDIEKILDENNKLYEDIKLLNNEKFKIEEKLTLEKEKRRKLENELKNSLNIDEATILKEKLKITESNIDNYKIKITNYENIINEGQEKIKEYERDNITVNNSIDKLSELQKELIDAIAQKGKKKNLFIKYTVIFSMILVFTVIGVILVNKIWYENTNSDDNAIENKQDDDNGNVNPPVDNESEDEPSDDIPTDTIFLISNILNNGKKGDVVKVNAEIMEFNYDSSSGTKFLKIADTSGTIDAVIFKSTNVPYIQEGSTYIFEGKIDFYNGKIEIIIDELYQG